MHLVWNIDNWPNFRKKQKWKTRTVSESTKIHVAFVQNVKETFIFKLLSENLLPPHWIYMWEIFAGCTKGQPCTFRFQITRLCMYYQIISTSEPVQYSFSKSRFFLRRKCLLIFDDILSSVKFVIFFTLIYFEAWPFYNEKYVNWTIIAE